MAAAASTGRPRVKLQNFDNLPVNFLLSSN